ncbi:DEAD/DEAH box helicase [Pyxidicoccus xibeiensis]|uniref:DEAD/DEAH box helicase n=1 Tax=Pyxidicoccus xibeiensis TaxID=2906759 RepID=UPI0020A7C6CF|nr:DEAD/DEAH box helicase [Pyxidicoccus xibeiensis]MCP3142356.1 DEAD/DEAH box helicase [Pyxidicoccus xibeiensis]
MKPEKEADAFAGPRRNPWNAPRGLDAVLQGWRSDRTLLPSFVLDEATPARAGVFAPVPEDVAPQVREALHKRGIDQLFSHQAEAYRLARAGQSLVIATPTASGKSLCYNLPLLDRFAREPQARALYLFPTKALSRDQEESLRALMREAGLNHGAITFDGDTPADARRAARERSGVLLTNPDMLHTGILPHHASWARLFSNLRYVVIDELHTYRGVFGSHLANVLRRLQRVARFHGADPVFVAASATIGNPQAHARRMLGREVALVSESGAPSGERRVMVFNPPVVNAELGIRASYLKTAVRLTSDLVRAGVSTLLFGQSRNNIEVMLKYLRDRFVEEKLDPSLIQGYRGGYLPGTRRATEAALRAGEVRCVVATNALELGIDIGSLDAVVCAGYPGSVAALMQRFGRAGRRGAGSLALLVTSSAPLDQYLAADPRFLVGAPVEHARIDPDNVEILVQHLKCASFELPFEEGEPFGDVPPESTAEALGFLAQHEVVHATVGEAGRRVYHWSTDAYPANHVSLRSVGWDNVVIIERGTDRTLAEMDFRSAHTMLHEQAIYQHEGEQYQVERFDYENHKAYVRKVAPDYFTDAMTYVRVHVIQEDQGAPMGPDLQAGMGEVSVIEKVVGYKKIKFHTHENVGYGDVTLPEMQMHTTALWLTVPESVVRSMRAPRPAVIDALRGVTNALRTVACVGLMIDPRDVGKTLGSRDDAEGPPRKDGGVGFDPTIFLYDNVPGGVGLAARLFDQRDELLLRARRLLESCQCEEGCPACIGPATGTTPGSAPVDPYPRKRLGLELLSALGVAGIQ